jgi:hypothetical protein
MNLQAIKARRGEISARLAAIASLVEVESRTLTDAEINETTTLEAEDKSAQATEEMLERQAARVAASAAQASVPVPAQPRGIPAAIATARPAAPTILTKTTAAQRNGDKFQGQTWARIHLAKLRGALALQKGEQINVPGLLASLYPGRPEIAQIANLSMRRQAAGVEGGAILSGEAGAELLDLDAQFSGDFIDFLYAHTMFDRMGFRGIDADVRVKGQDGAFTGYWVGEKRAIPASIGSFSTVDLTRLKAAGLTYLSRDLIERSAPSAELLFRDGVTQAVSQAVDVRAFSATAATSNVSPAGLYNGLTGQASAGGDLPSLYADLAYLTGIFVAAKQFKADKIKLVSNKVVANQIAHLLNPLTQEPAFKGVITADGGKLDGLDYLTGDNHVATNLCAIKTDDVWKIADSGVSVSISTDATIEADDTPTGEGVTPTAQSASMVSMFQTDMVAIKAVRDINYAYRRAQAIVTARITAADYNGATA